MRLRERIAEELARCATRNAASDWRHARVLADERRWAQRRCGSALPAFIVSDYLAGPVFCLIRDMSATGARLELRVDKGSAFAIAANVPDTFRLVLGHDESEVDCRVMWHDGPFLGLQFLRGLRVLTRMSRPAPRRAAR
jgi:hypothetical protein